MCIRDRALDAATQGFKDALTEKMPDVKFDEQNAAGDAATCVTITSKFAADGVDLILANATAPLQAAVSATGDIPILGTSITDYATALGMKEWNGTTGINVSGTVSYTHLDVYKRQVYPWPDGLAHARAGRRADRGLFDAVLFCHSGLHAMRRVFLRAACAARV